MSRTVDLHHHVIPDFYWDASNEDGDAAGGITPPRWSLDGAIAYLDEASIDLAVPSISTPGVHFGDDGAARTVRQAEGVCAIGSGDALGWTNTTAARRCSSAKIGSKRLSPR
jgi:hypothetical protein